MQTEWFPIKSEVCTKTVRSNASTVAKRDILRGIVQRQGHINGLQIVIRKGHPTRRIPTSAALPLLNQSPATTQPCDGRHFQRQVPSLILPTPWAATWAAVAFLWCHRFRCFVFSSHARVHCVLFPPLLEVFIKGGECSVVVT